MDPQVGLNAFGEGAKAVTKFQEIIQKVFGPRWTRKQADADAYADERKLQTIRDNPDMEIVYVNGQLNARERTPEALAYRAKQRELAESIRQERNIEKVIEVAANEIIQVDDCKVSDEPVDDDWITRLFQIVKDINSEEMQFVWGKILAGEIEQPGSFSFRTLDIIRNISKLEAKAFEAIIPLLLLVDEELICPDDSDFLEKYNVNYSTVGCLIECGLISSENLGYIHYNISNKPSILMYANGKGIVAKNLENRSIEFDFFNYKLTRAGRELYGSLHLRANTYDNYLSDIAKKISTQLPDVQISIYDIVFEDSQVYICGKPIMQFGPSH